MAGENGNGWKIPARVWQLGWVSFFADICSEIVYPVIPLFLKAIGAPATAMGAIEGAAEGLVSFMKGASGRHSDVTGKRTPYIRWGYALSALGKPLLAAATVWPVVLGGRLLDRFGKGIRTTARDALIVDSVDQAHYGKAFGLHRAMDTAGAFVGVLLALGFLALWPGAYRTMFLLAAIPGAVSVLLVMKVKEREEGEDGEGGEDGEDGLPDPDQPSQPLQSSPSLPHSSSEQPSQPLQSSPSSPSPFPSLSASLRQMPAPYWRALGLNALFALGNSSDTFLLLRARNLGLSDAMVILAYALYNVTFTIMAFPAGAMSDKLGRWRVLAFGWLIYAAAYWGFSMTDASWSWPALFGLFALYGLYIGFTQGVSKALVADHSPKALKGTAMGMYYFVTGFATLAASLLTGILWDRYSPAVAFQVAAGIAVVSAVFVPVTSMVIRRQKAE